MLSANSTSSQTNMNKLTEIQNELKAKKSCYNKFGKYHYRKCEDILEAVKPLLLKHKLLLTLSDEIKDCALGSYVESTAELTDGKEFRTNVCAQAGIEKAGGMALPQAFGSASSYSRKYALGAMFLLDDTEDPDATNDHKPTPKPPTQKEAVAKLGQAINADSLLAEFKKLPLDMQKNQDIIDFCKTKKEELTTK